MKKTTNNTPAFEGKKIAPTLQLMKVGDIEDFPSKRSRTVRQTIYNLQERFVEEGKKWTTEKVGFVLIVKRIS